MINLAVATKDRHSSVLSMYGECGYHGGLDEQDLILVAEESGRIVGAVRLCLENGFLVLRGMFILPTHQGRGIGSQMLQYLVQHHLDGHTCYCIPFAHLTQFYGAAGFTSKSPSDVPQFLAQRLVRYCEDGHDVILMARSSAA